MLFDSKFNNFKGKFNTHWLGPYEIEKFFDNGSVWVKTIDEGNVTFLVNGNKLKLYQNPQSKEECVEEIVNKKELEMVEKGVILSLPLPPGPYMRVSCEHETRIKDEIVTSRNIRVFIFLENNWFKFHRIIG